MKHTRFASMFLCCILALMVGWPAAAQERPPAPLPPSLPSGTVFGASVADAAFAPARPANPDYQPITSYQADVGARNSYYVNTTNDTVDAMPGNGICADSGGFCSLRAAVSEASSSNGVVYLPYGTYQLTIAAGPEENVAVGDLDVMGNVSIIGIGTMTPIIQGTGVYRLFDVFGTLVLRNVILEQGAELSAGGGCVQVNSYALFVFGSGAIRYCSAQLGGGVYLTNYANAIVEDAGLYNNTASGISAIGSSFGAMYASLALNDVDVSGNASLTGASAVNVVGWLNMVNVTVSGNTSVASSAGVAASPVVQGAVNITNSTIIGNVSSDNTPGMGGGLDVYFSPYGVRLYNTVLAMNTTALGNHDCGEVGMTGAALDILHHSLVYGIGNCNTVTSTNSLTGLDPLMRTLGSYGTGKWAYTMAFDFFSPLRDAGDWALCPMRDARGVLRVYGDSCDIGAYELITEDLAINGGFEIPGTSCGTNLTKWKKKPAYPNDKPMGNLTHVDSGLCAFRFKGNSAKPTASNTLRQVVTIPFAYRNCQAGMAFVARVKAPSMATDAFIRLRTPYLTGGAEVTTVNVTPGVGSFIEYHDWYDLSCLPVNTTTLMFTDRSPAGAWYLDNVRIYVYRYNVH